MRRRQFLAAGMGLGAIALTRVARAGVRSGRVLFLRDETLGPGITERVEWLAGPLAEAGFVVGSNLDLRLVSILPGEMNVQREIRGALAWQPDVIVTEGTYLTREAQKATGEIAIVFVQVADPVRAGIVPRLARPGGNVTGVTQFFILLAEKRLELIREVLPAARRVAVVWDRAHEYWPGFHQEFTETAHRRGLELVEGDMARGAGTWDDCFRQVMMASPHALMPIGPWPSQRVRALKPMQNFQERTRVPVFYGGVMAASDPLLIQLGANIQDHIGRGAGIVARILSGGKPGEIAVDQATRIILKVNQQTARRLGITLPKSVLVRADEVIE